MVEIEASSEYLSIISCLETFRIYLVAYHNFQKNRRKNRLP